MKSKTETRVPVRSDAGKSDTVEWENPVWPVPPGKTPSTCGLYVVSMYGHVHMASIHQPLIDNVPHVSIWDRTGRPVRHWNHEPLDYFRSHADSLYTAWKPLTLPESWQKCAKRKPIDIAVPSDAGKSADPIGRNAPHIVVRDQTPIDDDPWLSPTAAVLDIRGHQHGQGTPVALTEYMAIELHHHLGDVIGGGAADRSCRDILQLPIRSSMQAVIDILVSHGVVAPSGD